MMVSRGAVGSLALIPAFFYAVGTAASTGYGRPFMLGSLYGPGASHSAIGLALLLVGKILCPLAAAAIGLGELRREGSRPAAWTLILAGVALLLLGLATRQPYAN